MERYPGKWNSYSTWTWGRVGSFAFFFSPHELTNGKIIFLLGNFIIAELRVLQIHVAPVALGVKTKEKGGIHKHGIHTSYNTERNLSGDKLYFVTIFVSHHTFLVSFRDTDGYTVLSTTVKTQPFNNANVRKTGRNPSDREELNSLCTISTEIWPFADFDLVLFEIDVFSFPPADYQCSIPAVGSNWHFRDAAAQCECWLCRATVSLILARCMLGSVKFAWTRKRKKVNHTKKEQRLKGFVTWHRRKLSYGSKKKNGVLKPLFKALDMMIWCHWFKRNILTEREEVQAHNHCDMYKQTRTETGVYSTEIVCFSWENLQTCSICLPRDAAKAPACGAATRQRSSSCTDKPWQFKPDTIIRRMMRRAPMTRFLSDQFPALYPSIVSHCRARGRKNWSGWLFEACYKRWKCKGRGKEYSQMDLHRSLSQLLVPDFLYLLLPVEIAALITTSFPLKIIRMQTDHCGYSVCFSISS